MSPESRFLIGCFGISVVITYLCWVRFRVWSLRQDLFEIRDNLWDRMESEGRLDDPAHRELRDAINSLIRIAHFLSPLTILRILLNREKFSPLLALRENDELLKQTRAQVFVRVARYILLESASGWLVAVLAAAFGMYSAISNALTRRIEWLVDSQEFQTLDAHLSLGAR
jgi:hypothetical protein